MGGDHKCPLCSATFTRPQHVGRHLRAHTGDRPYACKECPLRFARSDLLSRHVNKAHPKPNGQPLDKNEKKSRRKSGATAASISGQGGRPPMPTQTNPLPLNLSGLSAQRPNLPEPTPYQAQRMYPNHPLLQQNHNVWAPRLDLNVDRSSMAFGPAGVSSDNKGALLDPSLAYMAPYGMPLSVIPGQESQSYNIGPSGIMPMQHNMGYEIPVKKRACDQCNHSKVRCDFSEPCARCAHRSIQCTYAKPQKARSMAYSITAPHSNMVSQSPPGAAATESAGAPVPHAAWETKAPPFSQVSSMAHLQPSPTQAGIELTPALTNSTSPTASSDDAFGSTTGSSVGGWMVNATAPSGTGLDLQLPNYNGISFQDGQSFDQASVSSSFTDGSGVQWSGSFNSSAVDDDDLSSTASVTDSMDGKDPLQRPSSTSAVWASAFDQMRLDDQGFSVDPAAMNDFQLHSPQRNSSMDGDAPPSYSRQQSGSDINFWKIFLDPMALATPHRIHDGEQIVTVETPRGLSKSNSMPDLTTPTIASASMGPFPQIKDGQVMPHPQSNNRPKAADDEAMLQWKDHIQQRHASFSMQLGPKSDGRTPKNLTNPSFASSRLNRPSATPLFMCTSLDQTLAPERMPSFGTPTPGYDATAAAALARVPLKLPHSQLAAERPTYKRQASQTLTQDTQKRVTFTNSGLDEGDKHALPSRRSSEGGGQQPLAPGQLQLPHRRFVPFATPFHSITTASDAQRAA